MKRRLFAAVFSAAIVFTLTSSAMAQTTRTFSLSAGDTMTPASPGFDPAGGTMYYGGLVAGQATGTAGGIFTLSLTFRSIGVVDAANGIYGGLIVSPYSSFVVNQPSGRKTVSTSGSINTGTVTYRLTPEGRADIISVSSTSLTVWEGKNKSRRAVGTGTLDYGTTMIGSGKLTLTF
ncbi:MAG TPA: hypothetical protein VJV03_07045 [Pyrinomonadaceae bacterium]|nr:hypothetical protein [Pyrinomonadaceae bacterium]